MNVTLSKLTFEVRLWTGYRWWVKVGHGKWEVDQCCLHVGGDGMWYLWPILGVEVRRCLNFCDEKIYSSWPRANGAEVGEMGHPAKDSGICVDNARCFKIFQNCYKGVFLGKLVYFLIVSCPIIWIVYQKLKPNFLDGNPVSVNRLLTCLHCLSLLNTVE